jgi:hypothetical protein
MNKEVIILGGGYSIKEGIEKGLWTYINKNNIDVWSLNYAFLTMPFLPNKQIWTDFGFFLTCKKELLELEKKNVELVSRNFGTLYTDFNITTYDWSLKKEKGKLSMGETCLVGTFALSLAEELKYKKIYLLGYDFGTSNLDDRKTHYYLDKNIRKAAAKYKYRKENGTVRDSIKDYEDFNKENIINVSINSNIPYFKKISYDKFFKELL